MLISYLRTILFYLVLIFSVRLMGKRQIGQMAPSEFVVTMLVANLASIPVQNQGIPLYSGLVPILTVLGAELVLASLSLRSLRLRKMLCGKPVILIENGHIVQKNLRRTRVTIDELMGQLREKDVLNLTTVQYAILETNGSLSVFPYPENAPASAKDASIVPKSRYLPVTIVEDGVLLKENLALSGKSESWVRQVLGAHRATIGGTWLLMVDRENHIVWIGKEAER